MKVIIVIAELYNLIDHRYETVSMIFNIPGKSIEIDVENLLQLEEIQDSLTQILLFFEILDSRYFETLDREFRLVRFWEANLKGLAEFPFGYDSAKVMMQAHFDVTMEDVIRAKPQHTNAVSIELTENSNMVETVKALDRREITIVDAKNCAAKFYRDELLALIFQMLDNVDIEAMSRQ